MRTAKKRIKTAHGLGLTAVVAITVLVLAAVASESTGGGTESAAEANATPTTTAIKVQSTTEDITTSEMSTTILPPVTVPPPVIHGVREIHVGRYGAVAYRQGVTVTDSAGEATLSVDSARVDTDIPGEYKVVYIAKSTSGQEARVATRVVVSGVTEGAVVELVAPVLEQLISNAMDDEQKARAVFDWIRKSIHYEATGERDGVLDGAYRGVTTRRGDCYTFFSLAKVMFEQAGLETIGIVRVPARTEHFWLLVSIHGAWYHIDPTPLLHPAPNEGFMMTESQIAVYDPFKWGFYYKYDPALLPVGVRPV